MVVMFRKDIYINIGEILRIPLNLDSPPSASVDVRQRQSASATLPLGAAPEIRNPGRHTFFIVSYCVMIKLLVTEVC